MAGGFGNHITSEAINGAVPTQQNSPQKPPLGLYPEQLSGSAFTQTRHENLKSWLYRILPSVMHGDFSEYKQQNFLAPSDLISNSAPNQLRWGPPSLDKDSDFVDGILTMVGNGSPESQEGICIHLYTANQSMKSRFFMNADAHMMIVPHLGRLLLKTEFGEIEVSPTEIAVIPKGIKFSVDLKDASASGYLCENFGAPFIIPDLGPIGSNGLANPRHFLAPEAKYSEEKGDFQLIQRFAGRLWKAKVDHSPLNVVGWHGNYWPYKYDLKLFNTINTVSFDHPDPSIFTVLTSPSFHPGLANCDFVIFPPRWMVAENTFRPPYYHRNIMSEFMGLIEGVYDAKEDGFVAGGSSLHNCFSAHGPDLIAFEKGTENNLKPERYKNTLAFMFETRLPYRVSPFALTGSLRHENYRECWSGLQSNFKKT